MSKGRGQIKLATSLSLNSASHPRKKACLLVGLQKATVALVGDDHFVAPVELESPGTKEMRHGALRGDALRCMLPASRKMKMEVQE
jgi:hypothetical protein